MTKVFSAPLVISADGTPPTRGWIETTSDGTILDSGKGNPPGPSEYFEGILIPGFINSHCHLELSHLKGIIPKHTGMTGFLEHIVQLRSDYSEQIQFSSASLAEENMIRQGIVAVGDISNNTLTLNIKNQNNIYYHTFVELIGLQNINANKIFNDGITIAGQFKASGLNATLVPHAPYSVSDKLLELISSQNELISIHMLESADEIEFCKTGKGKMAGFFSSLGIDFNDLEISDESPLNSILKKLAPFQNLILVHNTEINEDEIQSAKKSGPVYFCLCPNANQYINNKLPDFDLFKQDMNNVIIGTDSLASNDELSILSELKTIRSHSTSITLQQLIHWSTINGARALGIENVYGSLKQGKKPGINLLYNEGYESTDINPDMKVKRLT